MANMLLWTAIKAGSSKNGRRAITIALSLVLALLLLPLLMTASLLSVLVPGGLDLGDIKNSKPYRKVCSYYDDYIVAETEKAKKLAEKYYQDNWTSREEEIFNEKTQKIEKITEWYCAAEIKVEKYQYIETAYTLAYLSCKNRNQYFQTKELKIKKEELEEFWNAIGGKTEVDINESDPENPKYCIYNRPLSMQEIADKYFTTEDQKQEYYQSVLLFTQCIGTEEF